MAVLDIFDKIDGMLALVAKEKMPHYLFQELVNWEIGKRIGWLKKRSPYTHIMTQGDDVNLLLIQGIKEFSDKEGVNVLVALCDAILRELVVNGEYGASSAIGNDERTSGSTIQANIFNVLSFWNELRAGGGITNANNRAWWYGYIKDRGRFYDPVTDANLDPIPDGRYLEDQIYNAKLEELFGTLGHIGLSPTSEAYVADSGFSVNKHFAVYASPLIDGYQRGFYYLHPAAMTTDFSLYLVPPYSINIQIKIKDADKLKSKRITAIDLFIGESESAIISKDPSQIHLAHFLERVYLDKFNGPFMKKKGDLDSTPAAEKITINDFIEWCTNQNHFWIHNLDDDEWYYADQWTENVANMEISLNTTIGETPSDNGIKDFEFYTGWAESSNDYNYHTFYDNYYKKLGSEMFAHLGIPVGDAGLDDYRHKYSAWNGNRLLIFGLPSPEKHRAYYSTLNSPDVIPSLNRINVKGEITGGSTVFQNFILCTKELIERHYVMGNEESFKERDDIERGLVDQKALMKISDDLIAGFDYKGPWLMQGGYFKPIGEELSVWWNETLSNTVKDGCVTEYNFINDQLWFSFPDYNTSPYTNGICFVFDLRASRRGAMSPWWILKTDIHLNHFCRNYVNHLLSANNSDIDSKIVDFNQAGTDETVQTKLKLKMLQNPLLGRRTHWSKLRVDIRGVARAAPTDVVTCNCYFDEETTSSLSLTLNTTNMRAIIKYISETLEVELTTPASVNEATFRSLSLVFTPMRL